MTVSKEYNKHIYEGNGLTRDWPYDFDLPITAAGAPDTSLIHVFRTNLRGEVTEVTAFSVDAETGTLTYPTSGSPLETGEKLTILRLLDVRQQFFDPSNQANLYPETLEDNTDRLVMMVQQLQEETDRAVKVSVSTDLDEEDTTAEGIFEARDIAISAVETAEGWANTFPAIADELDVNIVVDEADLRAKLAAIGASNATLVIAKPVPIAEDLAIPSNVALSFKKTGQLQPAIGTTLTINGPIDAGLWQVFDGDGAVTGNPKIEAVYPEWFGAAGDGITDDADAINAAYMFARSCKNTTIILKATKYAVTQQIGTWDTYLPSIGTGCSVTLKGDPYTTLEYTGAAYAHHGIFLEMNMPTSINVENISYLCSDKVATGIRVQGNGAGILSVVNCQVKDAFQDLSISTGAAGISAFLGTQVTVRGCKVENVRRNKISDAEPVVGGSFCTGIFAGQAEKTNISDNYVKNVRRPEADDKDADGIKCFSTNTGGVYSEQTAIIHNNTVIDCEGRLIKLQTNGLCEVYNNFLKLEAEDLNLITNWIGIDSQVANANIHNNKFSLTGKRVAGSGTSAQIWQPQSPKALNATESNKVFYQKFNNNDVYVLLDGEKDGFPYFMVLWLPQDGVDRSTIIECIGNTLLSNGDPYRSTYFGAVSRFVYANSSSVGTTEDDVCGHTHLVIRDNIIDSYYFFSTPSVLEKGVGETENEWYARITTPENTKLWDYSTRLSIEIINNRPMPLGRSVYGGIYSIANQVPVFTSNVKIAGNIAHTGDVQVWAFPFDLTKIRGGSDFYTGHMRMRQLITPVSGVIYGTWQQLQKYGPCVQFVESKGKRYSRSNYGGNWYDHTGTLIE